MSAKFDMFFKHARTPELMIIMGTLSGVDHRGLCHIHVFAASTHRRHVAILCSNEIVKKVSCRKRQGGLPSWIARHGMRPAAAAV